MYMYIQCCCQLYIPVPMLIAQANFSRQWLYWIWKSSPSECERFNLYENAEPRMNAVYRNHVEFETKIMKIYETMWQVQRSPILHEPFTIITGKTLLVGKCFSFRNTCFVEINLRFYWCLVSESYGSMYEHLTPNGNVFFAAHKTDIKWEIDR